MDTILTSLAKTHHIVLVEQGWPTSGIGSEISARISESEWKPSDALMYFDCVCE